ncbi:MAG: hypothetical protein U0235_32650 [Polyangiaceae bacterium]
MVEPAVEDQAAGRARRIGQTRPVTVARIVTERTIEEKVIALHAKKRALYDDVIADADGAGTFELETLGALLAESWPFFAPGVLLSIGHPKTSADTSLPHEPQ